MDMKDVLSGIPTEGFLKVSRSTPAPITDAQRVALNRKGNQLFNDRQFEKAKRIFLTTGYSDGLIRLGDYYYEQNEPFEALKMYWLAPAKDKVDTMVERMASVIQQCLADSREKGQQ